MLTAARAAAVLAALVSLGAAAAGDVHVVLDVPVTEPWTDTGVDVGAGDRIAIRAWGVARAGGQPASPKGSGRGGGCEFVVVDAAVPAQAVVGNVAPALSFDGRGFAVGASWNGRAPVAGTTAAAGRLFVGFNDRAMACDRSGYDSWEFRNDNAGAFSVEVSVTRAR